jgi:hypothetical protein
MLFSQQSIVDSLQFYFFWQFGRLTEFSFGLQINFGESWHDFQKRPAAFLGQFVLFGEYCSSDVI